MVVDIKSSRKKELRNLILVIGSGVSAAVLLTVLMLYQYNPTGRYLAQNVLLAPQMMGQLSYSEKSLRTGGVARYQFERLDFARFDKEKQSWDRFPVSQEAYQEFFEAVAGDSSVQPVTDALRDLFNQAHLSNLNVYMQVGGESGLFQQVQFSFEGDFYRVQLRTGEQASAQLEPWAYFVHPGILNYTQALFTP